MDLRELVAVSVRKLKSHNVVDAEYDAWSLMGFLLNKDPLSLRLQQHEPVNAQTETEYHKLIERRSNHEPLQYIEKTADFVGTTLMVDPAVLIPRHDTEVLCEAALNRIQPEFSILDLCTGSGALAIALKKNMPSITVTASDISEAALEIARTNAINNQAEIRFIKSDLFHDIEGCFDMIVSNPPYIPAAGLQKLMPEVKREPVLALAGGSDGLDFYRSICKEAPLFLKKHGIILFEIGCDQKDDVCQILDCFVGNPFALRDYGGRWRVAGAVLREQMN